MTNDSNNNLTFSVTAVITAYNSEKYIGRAIQSVLDQTQPVDEIIVVNDGSTDDCEQEILKFGDQITYIFQKNQGASVARNTGINAANTTWIAFLDGDDEWLVEKNGVQSKMSKENPHLKWFSTNYFLCPCESDCNTQQYSIAEDIGSKSDAQNNNCRCNDFFTAFINNQYGHTGSMMITKALLLQAGNFKVGLKRMNDFDMWFRLAYIEDTICYNTQPLIVYHIGTPESIIKKELSPDYCITFIDEHTPMAKAHHKLDAFLPCARSIVQFWIRLMLTNNNGHGARKLIIGYRKHFSVYAQVTLIVHSFFPRLGRWYNLKKNIDRFSINPSQLTEY
jgi:glycosyltransferase involved in cell wall biosynthesis